MLNRDTSHSVSRETVGHSGGVASRDLYLVDYQISLRNETRSQHWNGSCANDPTGTVFSIMKALVFS